MSTKKYKSPPAKSKPFVKKGDMVMVVAGADKESRAMSWKYFMTKTV